MWSATSHIITGLIGAGVLSLAWSVAQLGWIAGPLCVIALASITTVSAFLLCDSYRYPDPEHGSIRNPSYRHAVKMYLGECDIIYFSKSLCSNVMLEEKYILDVEVAFSL